MEIDKIKAFMMTIELGSMRKAARLLNYTPSGLSHMLRSLEEEFGVVIAEKNNQGIELNENGRRLYPLFADLLRSCGAVDDCVRQLRESGGGALRFGTYCSALAGPLGEAILRYREKNPRLNFQIITYGLYELYGMLERGELDVVIAGMFKGGELLCSPLLDDEIFAVLSPERAGLLQNGAFPAENINLTGPFIPSTNLDYKTLVLFSGSESAPEHQLKYMLNDANIVDFAARGLGVGVMTSADLRLVNTENVLCAPFSPRLHRRLYVVCKAEALLRPEVGDFVSHIKKNVQ